ncbi:MAG: beta-lactamase family protein [Alphaproteobacteria bacterium]|nr:beta-lactamase family protein [Alphaproteobacteria bacterium]
MLHKPFTRKLATVAFFMAGSLCAPALADAPNVQQRLDGALAEIARDYPAGGPGLSFYADLGDGLIAKGSFGLANIEWGIPLDSKALHRIGSVSKSVTAIAALDLFEQRMLSLDAPISTFAPTLPPHMGERSMRQLLSHTSGLAEHAFNEKLLPHIWRPIPTDKIIEIEANTRPEFTPGAQYQYSNFNYVLVAHVLEQVTGQSFEHFIGSYLGRHNIDGQYDNQDKITPYRAEFYNQLGGELINTPAVDLSHVSAAGAILMSLEGMQAWGKKLMEGELANAGLVEIAWAPTKLLDGSQTAYGLGFNIGQFCGEKVLWHTGATPGARAVYAFFPNSGRQIVLLSNAYRDESLYGAAGTILSAVFGLDADADWAESTREQCSLSPAQ